MVAFKPSDFSHVEPKFTLKMTVEYWTKDCRQMTAQYWTRDCGQIPEIK